MKKKGAIEASTVFQFKITLNNSAPRIWRRILVPANYTFFDLHCAIQNAMGWTDGHLHAFYIREQKGRDIVAIEFPNPEGDDSYRSETRDERAEHIVNYFSKTIKQCLYSYDFGDSWDHTVLFERELPIKASARYPQCIAGKNACPPEDCGGVWGYVNLQKILKNPRHPEHRDTLEWLGFDDPSEFDLAVFSPDEVDFEDPGKRLKEYERGFSL